MVRVQDGALDGNNNTVSIPVFDSFEGQDSGKQCEYEHEWEHAVFGGKPVHDRDNIEYQGFLRVKGKPFFITKATGRTHEGLWYEWNARRHRKGRSVRWTTPTGEAVGKPPDKRFMWWAWLHAGRYHRNPQQAVLWWSGVCFLVGGIFFTIGGVGSVIKPVSDSEEGGPLTSWAFLVGYSSMVGTDLFFLPGVILTLVEVGNTDYEARRHAWRVGGCKGRKPGYKWFLPFKPHSIMSWASWLMLSGKLCFSTAFTTYALNPTVPLGLSPAAERWVIWVPATYGSACFAVFGWVQSVEASHSLWRGVVPSRRRDLDRVSFWSPATGFYGGTLFTLGSAAFLAKVGAPLSWGYNWAFNCAGFLIGSLMFVANGWLMLLEMSNP